MTGGQRRHGARKSIIRLDMALGAFTVSPIRHPHRFRRRGRWQRPKYIRSTATRFHDYFCKAWAFRFSEGQEALNSSLYWAASLLCWIEPRSRRKLCVSTYSNSRIYWCHLDYIGIVISKTFLSTYFSFWQYLFSRSTIITFHWQHCFYCLLEWLKV